MKTPPVLFSQHVHRAELLKLTLPIVQKINVVPVGKPFCPGFPTGTTRPGQKGRAFCPGSDNRDKKDICSRLVPLTGNKGATSADVADTPFDPGWYYQPGPKIFF